MMINCDCLIAILAHFKIGNMIFLRVKKVGLTEWPTYSPDRNSRVSI